MTISREEWELGRIDIALPILRLLSRRPDTAFTGQEVQRLLIEIEAREAGLEEVEQALHTLVSQRRIELKEIAGLGGIL